MQDTTINDWLESLSAKQPTPGGGAVAALSAAISAAQLSMVAAYTTGPKWQDREARMQELNVELESLRTDALALVQADAEAFASVGAAYQLPKNTDQEKSVRDATIQEALVLAADPPRETAAVAAQLVEIADELAGSGNPNVISDVAVGTSMARAALEAAIVNIEINERTLDNADTKAKLHAVIQNAETAIERAGSVTAKVREQLA